MSLAALTWAKRQTAGGVAAKAVLMALADVVDGDGIVRPDVRRLADELEASHAEIEAALDTLVLRGLLQRFPTGEHQLPQEAWFQPPVISKQRRRLYERDGFRCVYCSSDADLTLDHVQPRSRGGSDRDENLVTCCRRCNMQKGARTPEEWRG